MATTDINYTKECDVEQPLKNVSNWIIACCNSLNNLREDMELDSKLLGKEIELDHRRRLEHKPETSRSL